MGSLLLRDDVFRLAGATLTPSGWTDNARLRDDWVQAVATADLGTAPAVLTVDLGAGVTRKPDCLALLGGNWSAVQGGGSPAALLVESASAAGGPWATVYSGTAGSWPDILRTWAAPALRRYWRLTISHPGVPAADLELGEVLLGEGLFMPRAPEWADFDPDGEEAVAYGKVPAGLGVRHRVAYVERGGSYRWAHVPDSFLLQRSHDDPRLFLSWWLDFASHGFPFVWHPDPLNVDLPERLVLWAICTGYKGPFSLPPTTTHAPATSTSYRNVTLEIEGRRAQS